ncbi:hypothetical protein C8Q77DRAFT_1151886 [Trametes polyzona]|nr:hypothetical protein C8Q77DRAFT_1151886 [Trametes polyzona]
MPRAPKNKITPIDRRTTRSMTRKNTLNDIVNVPLPASEQAIGTGVEAAGPSVSHSPEALAVATSSAPNTAKPRLTFRAGDEVLVYGRVRGEWNWRRGKVPNLRRFKPRPTTDGFYSYPAILEQGGPRTMQWFDEAQGHIKLAESNL